MRGTFANIRIKNQMVKDEAGNVVEGGYTIHQPSGERMAIYDAAMRYQAEKVPLVVFAGREYGTGSSRDWAAKGTKLLGVRAVIAQSFERIHRSNLVGMGVLPLVFEEGTSWSSLGLKGDETVTIHGLGETLKPRQTLHAEIKHADGRMTPRAAHVPHRHARRARIFPQRRHPALRAAAAGGVGVAAEPRPIGSTAIERRRFGQISPRASSCRATVVRPPLLRTSSIMCLVAAGSVAALAVPEADEIDPVRAEPQRGVQHPAVVALVWIFALLRRTKLERRDMEDAARLGGEETRAPVAAGEVDRFFQKRRLLEGDVKLKAGATRQRRFCEQKIAAARAAADCRGRAARCRGPRAPRLWRAPAIGSLSGGKRGFSRPGASIMWPLNSTTLRGDQSFGSPMRPLLHCQGKSGSRFPLFRVRRGRETQRHRLPGCDSLPDDALRRGSRLTRGA